MILHQKNDLKMTEQRNLQERLHFQGDLQPVFDRAAHYYGIESLPIQGLIEVGYEDYNIRLGERYLAKVFANIRKPEDVDRYIGIMTAVDVPGVNHPRLHEGEQGIAFRDSETELRMVLMDFIDGQTFYDMDRVPDDAELKEIIGQAVKINKIEYKPPFLHDSWSVTSLDDTYERVKAHLATKDVDLAESIIKEFHSKINIEKLPSCLVHGDIIKTNVIKRTSDEEMFIIDFSVANWYPRIQELAVIVANLLNAGQKEERTLNEKIDLVVQLYKGEGGDLTEAEEKALPIYIKAALLMEFLGAHQEKFLKDDDRSETTYWLENSRQGLKNLAE